MQILTVRKCLATTLVVAAVVASLLLTPSAAFAECGDSQCQAGGCYDWGFCLSGNLCLGGWWAANSC